jgi:hypothetical protein
MNALFLAKYGAIERVIAAITTVKKLVMLFTTKSNRDNYMYGPTIIQDLDDNST